MITYDNIKNKPKIFRCLTSLNGDEFNKLLPDFKLAYDDFVYESQVKGRQRERKPGGGRKPILKEYEDRLLFILFYFKVYPLQEVLGFLFGMGQSQANEWIHRLTEVLNQALGYQMQLPERNPKNLEQVLRDCPGLEFIIDGTERAIRRPKDRDAQKRFYSGKKKRHTRKNNLIGDLNSKKIKYLSGTYEGKKHDKAVCDEEDYQFPEGSILLKDLGFKGLEPENVITLEPKKKPRGKELSEQDKANNRVIARLRVGIEHIIGSVKICRIVKDIFRNYKGKYDDLVMETACGLHNLRVSSRYMTF